MAYFAAPVLAALFGPAGFLAVLLGNLVVMLVLLPTTIILTQIDGPEAANAGRSVVIDSMVSAITNPIVWLPMLGVMLRFSGITLPHPLALSIDTIATSAGGTSLFALGLMLYGERVRFNANVLEKWLGLSEQPLTFDKWIVCGLVVQAAACGASWRSGVARPE